MRFPVCWKVNFAGYQTHRKRGKSARANPSPHHTLLEEQTARVIAQPLPALLFVILCARSKNPENIWSSLLAPDLQKMTASELFKMTAFLDQRHEQQANFNVSFMSTYLMWGLPKHVPPKLSRKGKTSKLSYAICYTEYPV